MKPATTTAAAAAVITLYLLAAFLMHTSSAAMLRRRADSHIIKHTNDDHDDHDNNHDTVICRITVSDTIYSDNDNSQNKRRSERIVACIPFINNVESHLLLPIVLPVNITKQYLTKIHQGKLIIKMHGATINNNTLQLDNHTTFNVLDNDDVPQAYNRRTQQLVTTGNMTVLIVRVTTKDKVSPMFSLAQMRHRMFGDDVGMKSQFRACSFGQLNLVDVGGMEVTLPKKIARYKSGGKLLQDAEDVIFATTGKYSYELADKVMFCQPPGTGAWVANAGVNYYRSNYNNEWCLSLSADMHEMGHSLGLLHSGEGDDSYADETGYMGYGIPDQDVPQNCFNGFNNHMLGWYQSREVLIDPAVPNLIELAAFADFDKTHDKQPVLLNIANQFYIQFNKAKLFNIDTPYMINAVTITENTPGWSSLRAGLFPNDKWQLENFADTGRALVVKACYQVDALHNSNNVDSMIVSIGLDADHCGRSSASKSNMDY